MLNLGRSIQLNTIHSAAKTSRNLLLPFLNAKNFYYTEDCVRRDLADNVAHDTHNIYKTLRPQQGKTWRGLAPITQAHKITHPEKDICEDAYFINGNTFGIADGVGVWSQVGGNSALYSKSLMEHIEEALCEKEGCSLYEALVHGYTKVCLKFSFFTLQDFFINIYIFFFFLKKLRILQVKLLVHQLFVLLN